ncbi:MAG TPA: oligosaccharide flippase family protein [Gaiellaceae bacterium]|nr:oligosaccharide flippase family protein [Gaiellaceae bacterium]
MTTDGDLHPDVLDLPAAGRVAIRGGIVRTVGYFVGTAVGIVSTIVLLRYLGAGDYGRYATVISIAAVTGALADAGVAVVSQRDFATLRGEAERRELQAHVAGLRIVLAPAAAVIAVTFALVAGYDRTMVEGVAIGALGVLLVDLWQTALLPATTQLRFGILTTAGLVRDVVTGLGLLGLVLAGATLLPFLAVPTIAALAVLVFALSVAGVSSIAPRFSWQRWRPLLIDALPLGIATVIGSVYLRLLLIIVSLATGRTDTGLYALSNRVLQVLATGAAIAFSSAFPILARASGDEDEERLAFALQQLFEVAVFLAVAGALIFAIAARPIAVLLGGSGYAGAARALRIQAFAMFGTFLGLVWLPALVAVHRQRARIAVSLCGLAMAAVAGGPLIVFFGITGAAVAAVLGEATIAAAGLTALVRARPALRPKLGAAATLLACGAVSAWPAFVSAIPAGPAACLAVAMFVALAWFSGALPRDVVRAVLAR